MLDSVWYFVTFCFGILGSGVAAVIGVGVASFVVMAFYWKIAEPLGFYAHHRLKSLLDTWDFGNGETKDWTERQLKRRAVEAEIAKAISLKSLTTVLFLVSVAGMFCMALGMYELSQSIAAVALAISGLDSIQMLFE